MAEEIGNPTADRAVYGANNATNKHIEEEERVEVAVSGILLCEEAVGHSAVDENANHHSEYTDGGHQAEILGKEEVAQQNVTAK